MKSAKARAWKMVSVCAAGMLVLAVTFSSLMAMHAYRTSHETGAGAAQGNLGFFMILLTASPAILGVTALAWWIDRAALRARLAIRSSSPLVVALCVLSILALGWNWFYLEVLWGR